MFRRTKAVVATAGDILLPRVGSRCLHHAAIIKQGKTIITDCIYRLTVPDAYRHELVQRLRSSAGIQWRAKVSHGTCAKVLTRENILSFPGVPHTPNNQ